MPCLHGKKEKEPSLNRKGTALSCHSAVDEIVRSEVLAATRVLCITQCARRDAMPGVAENMFLCRGWLAA
jgi:hypothetical protein